MFVSSAATFGVAAAVIALLGEITYNWSIWTGATRPDRTAWWVLAMGAILMTASHAAVGGGWTVLVPAVTAIGIVVSALLSLRHGARLAFGPLDRAMLAVTGISLMVWLVFGLPLVTLLAMMAINSAGMALNIRKAWLLPRSEAVFPWVLTVASGFLNLLAIELHGHDWILPWYLVLTDGMMLGVILAGLGRGVAVIRTT